MVETRKTSHGGSTGNSADILIKISEIRKMLDMRTGHSVVMAQAHLDTLYQEVEAARQERESLLNRIQEIAEEVKSG
jgi:uncharacterized coiled-coil DUF342 family protein